MGIKRNEVAEPQWNDYDYVTIAKEDLFSEDRWKNKVDWEIILKQVEKTWQASQMIDIHLYPSTLFTAAVDMLEANLYVIDDMFYYLTGLRMNETKVMSEEALNVLGFWNMDCYKVLEQIEDRVKKTKEQLIECLKHESIWDITLKVIEKEPRYVRIIGKTPIPTNLTTEKEAITYAREHYKAEKTDQEALASQISNILRLLDHYNVYSFLIYRRHFHFSELLAKFRQSEIAQTDFIEPWRHDFGGTRDSLIAKMEKDPKLGPWVNRYDHLPKTEYVYSKLFYDVKRGIAGPVDKEACFNTDNWISILTVAAVLQEYDEQHAAATATSGEEVDEDVLSKLYLYFKDEATIRRFLYSATRMNDTETITLVKKYRDAGLCTDTSKALWRVLHDAKLYKAKYSNWNGLLNKP